MDDPQSRRNLELFATIGICKEQRPDHAGTRDNYAQTSLARSQTACKRQKRAKRSLVRIHVC